MLDLFLKTTTKASYYTYGSTASTAATEDFFENFATLGAGLIALFVVLAIICLAIIIFIIVCNCKIFAKAGQQWWKALIPLYNSWVETKIAGLAWWWYPIFVGLTALIAGRGGDNFVLCIALTLVSFNYCYGMAKKFGKSNGFAVLLAFIPIVGLPMLAFGSAKYDKDAKVDENGIFSIK